MEQQLVVNTLIKYKDNENIERVLWLDKITDVIVLINIFDNSWPKFQDFSYIQELLVQKNIEILDNDPFFRIVNEDEISTKDKEKRDFAWEIYNCMLTKINTPEIFIKEERRKVLTEIISEFNISRNTVDNYLKRFWKRGQVKNALMSDYLNCGGPGKERKITEKKRGRPLKIKSSSHREGVNIDENMKRIFRISINRYYNTTKKNPLTTVYELMIKDFFTEKYVDKENNKSFLIKQEMEIPTLQQFRYWFNKERNLKKEKVSRYSLKEYELTSRAIMGKNRNDGLYPTAKYQIDATIADVYIVSRFNRNWIIGRPIVYFIVDTYSSMVVGLNVTLEGPSFIGAMGALANCFINKKEFCKEYDIDIQESDWPVGYIPDTIICDRGELLGEGIETLISNLGVTVENTASFRGDMKAMVERFFKTIHSRVKPFTPGFIDSDFRKRGGRDYRLDAKLDIYQFTQIMIKCVLQNNNYHILSEYDREALMIKDNIEPVPISLWNWGIRNKSGILRRVDNDIVKISLMPREKAVVTEHGMRLRGIFYSSETAIRDHWFEKARINGSWKIDVSYDPRSMKNIYIILENGRRYEKCSLLQHQARYINRTLEEIEYLLLEEKITNKEKDNDVLQSKIDLYADIESIVDNATTMTDKTINNNESNARRIKGIRNNRKIEKYINRENDVFRLDNGNDIITSGFKDEQDLDYAVDDITVLRNRLNERKSK